MIITRTPYRVSFFGGGTDYPAWYREHGGAVLSTTIDKYCYLSCRHLPPFFEHRIRIVYSKIESCNEINEIQHPAVREALRYLKFNRGVEIHHDGDLPARSGMGSSSAFTVGLLNALYALRGQMVRNRFCPEKAFTWSKRFSKKQSSVDQFRQPTVGSFSLPPGKSPSVLVLPPERLHPLFSPDAFLHGDQAHHRQGCR